MRVSVCAVNVTSRRGSMCGNYSEQQTEQQLALARRKRLEDARLRLNILLMKAGKKFFALLRQ